MGVGQEIHDDIVLGYRHTLEIGLKCGMELAVGKDHSLAVASRPAGIEDVADIVERGLGVTFLHLSLARVVLAEFQEIVKIDGVGITGHYSHTWIEDDNALERGAQWHNTMGLVVLLLLTYKEDSDLCIVNHETDLLLAACGIERHGDGPDAKGAKIGVDILHGVL